MKPKLATHGIELVAVGEASLSKAETRLVACQGCSPAVSRSFSSVLIEVLGAATPMTEYVLCGPARCPNCARPIFENTLVRCEGERGEETAFKTFEPCWEETDVVLVDETHLSEAQSAITGCEQCVQHAEITFDYVLDEVMSCDPQTTEYVLCRSAKCPRCHEEVSEKTLVIC